jgi:hypothetical protein
MNLNNDGYATTLLRGRPSQIGVLFDGFAGFPIASLGTLAGQSWSVGHGINSNEQIVGQSGPYAFL